MKAWLLAWQFLTRLPVKVQGTVDDTELASSVMFYPVVGAVLGATFYVFRWAASQVLPPLTVGLLLVALQVLLTGGLHLDGLCDLADGWYGSRERERRLEIMHDSRIGALGAICLLLVVLLKASLLASLQAGWLPLVIYESLAKLTMVFCLAGFPHAQSTGTGAMLRQVGARHAVVAALLPLGLLAFASWPTILAVCLAETASLLLAARWSAALGGLTGDCYGAVHEVFQVLLLLALEAC